VYPSDGQDRIILADSKEMGHSDENHVACGEFGPKQNPTWSINVKNAFFILVLAAWGCIGITQTSFGFHNVWEFWAYQAFYGIFVCPWYAVSVSASGGAIAELVSKR
jgi:hypothetical protein